MLYSSMSKWEEIHANLKYSSLPNIANLHYIIIPFKHFAGAGRSRGFWLEPEQKFSPGSGS